MSELSTPHSACSASASRSPAPKDNDRAAFRLKNARPSNLKAWRSLWFKGDLTTREQLWPKHESLRQYSQAYRLKDDDFIYWQEEGMKYFVKIERALMKHVRLRDYRKRGKHSLDRLWTNLSQGRPCSHETPVLVSIDFEGLFSQYRGITEFGISTIDFNSAATILTRNYAAARVRGNKCLFGPTTRVSSELLPKSIINCFDDLAADNERRDIVLVCHGLQNEVDRLDSLGIAFEDLHITGMVDILPMAKEVLGQWGSLTFLVEALGIELIPKSQHCAGNDAHYTLQVLLSLLQMEKDSSMACVEELVRKSPPIQPPSKWTQDPSDDWDMHLDGVLCA